MSMRKASLISAMIFAVLLPSGCSFLFVSGPPANHAQVPMFECTDSNAWPVIDAIWAGLNGIGAASAAGDDQNMNQGQIVAVGLTWLVLSGASAIYGFSKVSECSAAKRLRDEQYYPPRIPAPAPMFPPPAAAPPPPPAAAPPPPPAVPPPPAAAPPPASPAGASSAQATSPSRPRSVVPSHLAMRSSS